MGSLANIRTALVDQIREAMVAVDPNITVVSGRYYNPTPPCIDVYQASTARSLATAGFGDLAGAYVFTVRARVLTADNLAGQELLVRFEDDEDDLCIPAAIVDDRTLGGYATDVHVPEDGFSGDTLYEEGGHALLGCQWRVEVIKAWS